MNATINKTVLKNGVRILSHKMPHVRSVSMGVWVNVGARDEKPSENGLSHFIEHMIFKGTQKRGAFQIAKEFDAIGGHTNAFTAMENTCYHARVIDTHLFTMADILSDIFLNSVFDEQEVEKERTVIFQEIGMVEDSPEEYIHLLAGKAYWGNNPLGRSILGTPENIVRFDKNTIRRFFRRFYQPGQILVSLAGNVDHDRFVDLIGPAFETVRPGKDFPKRVTPRPRSRVDLNFKELEQAHVVILTSGLSITDPRRYAFSLLQTILGGNMSSRLFQEVRERKGLAYSIYSFVSSHVDTGLFGVYTGVDPKQINAAVGLILKEMRKLKEDRVEASELQGAKEYIKGNLMLSLESTDNQMVRTAQNEFHFGCQIPIQEVVDRIESVTEDDILHLASTLFQSEQLAVTLLGRVPDKKELQEILAL
ncbi:MAG: pitrilysin family protein [Desulfobacterales bacterium]|nr:pitrilysin family protein [Desulfobacterales bacterium]